MYTYMYILHNTYTCNLWIVMYCIVNINVYNLTLNMYFYQPFPSKLHLDCKGMRHVLIHLQSLSLASTPFSISLTLLMNFFTGPTICNKVWFSTILWTSSLGPHVHGFDFHGLQCDDPPMPHYALYLHLLCFYHQART
jgi:hypothetical protein